MNQPTFSQDGPDFSLVLGGPLFQLFRRVHLSGPILESLHRRIIIITMIAWLPLLTLSSLGGHAFRGSVSLPFLYDIETQIRFLIVLPVLIAAELIVHLRLQPVVQSFVNRKIVVAEDLPKFRAAINSATRLGDSTFLEVGLVIVVFTVGYFWRTQVSLDSSSWYEIPEASHLHFTSAGYWNAFISIPIFQFILLRWYLRLLIWFWFLWQVSRLKLHLVPTHPDRAAGLAFLGTSSYTFAPILFAHGALLAGLIANHVIYGGESLRSFKMEAAGMIGFLMFFILSPLTVFTSQLVRAKRKGLADYGSLASDYVEEFETKWVPASAQRREELLGAPDIQSLADLGNSYAVVREMRPVPFGLQEMGRLAAVIAAPLVPLSLTIFSPEELLLHLMKIIF